MIERGKFGVTKHLLCVQLVSASDRLASVATDIAEPLDEQDTARLIRDAVELLGAARRAAGPCDQCPSRCACEGFVAEALLMKPGQR